MYSFKNDSLIHKSSTSISSRKISSRDGTMVRIPTMYPPSDATNLVVWLTTSMSFVMTT